MIETLIGVSPTTLAVVGIALSLLASAHIVLHKRDVAAAIGWVGVVWLAPLIGPVLYLVFGINRIRRRASRLRPERFYLRTGPGAHAVGPEDLHAALPPAAQHLTALRRSMDQVTHSPLTTGNQITLLVDGDAAYPVMVAAIDRAARSVALSSYIFDSDDAGWMFADALERAVVRGVEVRVLIDAVGVRYSRSPIPAELRRRKIAVAEFLRPLVPWRMPYVNLRNHRKLLIVDGSEGFTGGMNIREGHRLGLTPDYPIQDLHFHIEGPVVAQMMDVFAEDWAFTTSERLAGDAWFPDLTTVGTTLARGIAAGPDEDFERLYWACHGALSCARHSVRILTPYFLPDRPLVTALQMAALRGVDVDIVLPAQGNLRLVQWAAHAQLHQVLEWGCRIWLTPPPFDHSKLLLVDGAWVLIGSANWDARSLRLNFEFDVECYDVGLAARLEAVLDRKCRDARPLALEELRQRNLAARLRDGVAWLLSPYL